MDINFSLNSEKMKGIDILLEQLNKRVKRLETKVTESKSFVDDIKKTGNISSGVSISEAESLSKQLDATLAKYRNYVSAMTKVVGERKGEFKQLLMSFSNENWNGKKLADEIERTKEEIYTNHSDLDEDFKNKVSFEKISHQSINSRFKKFKESIIQVNNESIHISTRLIDIRTLMGEVIDEYHQARLAALESLAQPSITQLICEQIANFKPLQDMVSEAFKQNDTIQNTPRLCSCGGRGRTAFC